MSNLNNQESKSVKSTTNSIANEFWAFHDRTADINVTESIELPKIKSRAGMNKRSEPTPKPIAMEYEVVLRETKVEEEFEDSSGYLEDTEEIGVHVRDRDIDEEDLIQERLQIRHRQLSSALEYQLLGHANYQAAIAADRMSQRKSSDRKGILVAPDSIQILPEEHMIVNDGGNLFKFKFIVISHGSLMNQSDVRKFMYFMNDTMIKESRDRLFSTREVKYHYNSTTTIERRDWKFELSSVNRLMTSKERILNLSKKATERAASRTEGGDSNG